MKKLLNFLMAAMLMTATVTAQTVVTTHWPLDKSIQGLTYGPAA